MSAPDITQDTLLGGKVTLFQPKTGFRAGTDSVLLAASLANLKLKGQNIAEFGCGAGGALFPAMYHLPNARFTGVEQDEAALQLAERSAEANKVTSRLSLEQADIAAFAAENENTFDLVFANPPYFEPGEIREPGEGKAGSYIHTLGLDEWLKAMLMAMRPQGFIVLIHRSAELAKVLRRLDKQAGEITVMPIRPYPGAEANRILVSARKGLRSGRVRLLAGLDIYQAKGEANTDRAEAALLGKSLNWI